MQNLAAGPGDIEDVPTVVVAVSAIGRSKAGEQVLRWPMQRRAHGHSECFLRDQSGSVRFSANPAASRSSKRSKMLSLPCLQSSLSIRRLQQPSGALCVFTGRCVPRSRKSFPVRLQAAKESSPEVAFMIATKDSELTGHLRSLLSYMADSTSSAYWRASRETIPQSRASATIAMYDH